MIFRCGDRHISLIHLFPHQHMGIEKDILLVSWAYSAFINSINALMGRCCSSFNDATYSETEATPIWHLHSSKMKIKSSVKCRKTVTLDGFSDKVWSEWGDSNSRHLAPKASALPTALHPDMKFSNCGQTCGQRRFLTSYRRGESAVGPGVPRLSGFSEATARTWASRSQSKRATNCATPGYFVGVFHFVAQSAFLL